MGEGVEMSGELKGELEDALARLPEGHPLRAEHTRFMGQEREHRAVDLRNLIDRVESASGHCRTGAY